MNFSVGSSACHIIVSQIQKRNELDAELTFDWRELPERKASRIVLEKRVSLDDKNQWNCAFSGRRKLRSPFRRRWLMSGSVTFKQKLMSFTQEMFFMSYDTMRPLEKDWKLFRKKLPAWQEDYMAKLNREYQEILAQDKNPSDIFWELEKRIWQDKKKTGVIVRGMSRSNMWIHMMELLMEGAVTLEDLSEFSEDLQERMAWIMKCSERQSE